MDVQIAIFETAFIVFMDDNLDDRTKVVVAMPDGCPCADPLPEPSKPAQDRHQIQKSIEVFDRRR